MGDVLPHNANDTWHNFAAAIIKERDPHRITGLIAQLNQDLAAIDKNDPESAVTDSKRHL